MKYLLTLLFATFIHFSFAQIEPADSIFIPNIKSQGDTMAKLLITKHYKAFARYAYPSIIKKAGGEENMVQLIKQTFDKLEEQGILILNCTISIPTNIVHSKRTIQCVLTEIIEMKVPNGHLTANSNLIGISIDNGGNWTFIDTHGKDLKTLQLSLPELSDSLVMPIQPTPVFLHD